MLAALQGQATASAADVTARIDIKSLTDLESRFTGRAALDAP